MHEGPQLYELDEGCSVQRPVANTLRTTAHICLLYLNDPSKYVLSIDCTSFQIKRFTFKDTFISSKLEVKQNIRT